MSYILWYPTHVILSFLAFCLRWLLELLYGSLVDPGLSDATHLRRILVRWLNLREEALQTHLRYITDGLGKAIIKSPIKAQDVDLTIVTKLFNLLAEPGDENKLRRAAASILRHDVLDSSHVSHPEKWSSKNPSAFSYKAVQQVQA